MAKRLVYLDNAATTPVRPEVLEAMLPYLGKDAFGNPSSAHRFGRTARAGVEEAKRTIAEALGVEPGQVIFTSGGTEADNLAVIGSALAARDRGGPFRVAVAATEHKAVLAAAHAVQHLGGDEVVLPVDASGVVEEAAVERALASGVAVVSVMWVNNEVGTIQPVARVAARCCEAEVPRRPARRREQRYAGRARAPRRQRRDPRDRLRSSAHASRPRRHCLLVGVGLQHRGGGAVARAQRDGRAARARRGGAALFVREGQRGGGRGYGHRCIAEERGQGSAAVRGTASMRLGNWGGVR